MTDFGKLGEKRATRRDLIILDCVFGASVALVCVSVYALGSWIWGLL